MARNMPLVMIYTATMHYTQVIDVPGTADGTDLYPREPSFGSAAQQFSVEHTGGGWHRVSDPAANVQVSTYSVSPSMWQQAVNNTRLACKLACIHALVPTKAGVQDVPCCLS